MTSKSNKKFIDELKSIIDPKNIYSGDTKDSIVLKEDSPKSKCQSFKLRKSERIKTLTLNIDREGFDAHPILRAIENLKKHPDYIIFCEDINLREIYVLIIELKSDDKDDFHRKVRAGIALADYLVGMLENYN
jgi:hypothetical protein